MNYNDPWKQGQQGGLTPFDYAPIQDYSPFASGPGTRGHTEAKSIGGVIPLILLGVLVSVYQWAEHWYYVLAYFYSDPEWFSNLVWLYTHVLFN